MSTTMRVVFSAILFLLTLVIVGWCVARQNTPYRIAFTSAFEESGKVNTDVCVVNSDGTGFRRLTNAPGEDTMPAFSPDGNRIAFVSSRDENRDVWVMDANGNNQRRLTD